MRGRRMRRAMPRGLRLAGELGALVFWALTLYSDLIPPSVGLPLLFVGCVLFGLKMASRIHDRNESHEDTTSLNLRG